jgi:MFS family permease
MLRVVSGTLKGRVRGSWHAVQSVFWNPNLRRLELARAVSVTSGWAYAVALSVFAFERGGASAVGIVGLIVMLPAAFAAPFTAVLADRFPRERVMLVSTLLRVLALAGTAGAMLDDAPAPIVYTLAAVASILARVFAPAQAAAVPSLARTPAELAAANVVSSTIDSVGLFLGPALGGLLLAVTSPGVVVAVTAATLLLTALFISRIVVGAPHLGPTPTGTSSGARDVGAGFRTIAREPALRLLVGLYSAQTLVAGALNVLIVVVALDLLELGDSGVGYLNSAFGVGALLGAPAALLLVGRERLASRFGLGILLWGIPIALVGLWPRTFLAVLLFGIVGFGNTVVDVAILTLLQRGVSDEVLARVFGVLEGVTVGAIGVGAVLAPALIGATSEATALVVTGAILPIVTLITWRRLAAIDAAGPAPQRELALLRAVPFLSSLPAATLAQLAQRLAPARFPAGTTIVAEGDRGDRLYVMDEGSVDVVEDGRRVVALGPGDYFGEIALLGERPRVASVVARTPVVAYTLDGRAFVSAVTGHPATAEAAHAAIATRLRSLRPGLAPLGS